MANLAQTLGGPAPAARDVLESFMLERGDVFRVRHGLYRIPSTAYGTYNNSDEIYIPGMGWSGREYAVSCFLITASTTCKSRGTTM